ncbi:MAG: 3'-5' exonuclease [Bacteroidia bacterium]|nr:3'-5' exonuclease [Bacteroidota bacterium]MCZ2130873.1 3'-5' exonuclease [Bacteroidia bacterium]
MRILENIDLKSVLVMDIETVSGCKNFSDLPEKWQQLWSKKANNIKAAEEDTPESLYPRAAIYSEFGKVISICCGIFIKKEGEWFFKLKDFSGHDESVLLNDFADMLNKHFTSGLSRFCTHNGREFDIPYLCRRMIINGIKLPAMMDMSGLKPWEIQHIDTLELWKFGDYKAYTSLNVLAAVLDIPSPKDDIDGSMVGAVYWQENDLHRIVTYCKKDVVTTARVLMKLKGLKPIEDDYVIM